MLEKDFKKKAKIDLTKQGWRFIELAQDGIIPMGFPDTLCLSPNGYLCFVEWKKAKGAKRQPLQNYWNNKLNEMGHDAFFVYPENYEEWYAEAVRKSGELSRQAR